MSQNYTSFVRFRWHFSWYSPRPLWWHI